MLRANRMTPAGCASRVSRVESGESAAPSKHMIRHWPAAARRDKLRGIREDFNGSSVEILLEFVQEIQSFDGTQAVDFCRAQTIKNSLGRSVEDGELVVL